VSNLGRYEDWNGFRRKCGLNPSRYEAFSIGATKQRKTLLLHRVVHVLFNDPDLEFFVPGSTVDHKNRKIEDNAALNLRWATPKEQSSNSSCYRFSDADLDAQRHKVSIRRPDGSEARVFGSMTALAAHFDCKVGGTIIGHISRKGWIVEKVADEDLNGELWKAHENGWKFSNLGRVSRDGVVKRFPASKDAAGYVRFEVDGKRANLPRCILEAFGFERPTSKHTVDHKNRVRSDNRLCNLHWATKSEQRRNQEPRTTRERRPFEGRATGSLSWAPFESIEDAERATGCSKTGMRNVLNKASRAKTAGNPNGVRFEFRVVVDAYQNDNVGEVWKDVVPADWCSGGKYYRLHQGL
jgi:hypothetical protein